ncbi:MAG: WecB/TagA/CpsF family glycosyltransferase [Gammaproteobacteria bacterium]
MPLPFKLDDYSVEEFVRLAADFGEDKYGFVVTPNVDHLIRFHDDPAFRALYGEAAYILLDSRFLSHLFSITQGLHAKVCPGSDLTAQLFDHVIQADDPILLIGGDDWQAPALADRYGLKGLRHFNPPMGFIRDPAAVEECLKFIESQSPFRFCLLAVGAPQQEILAQQLKARGRARGLALCVGASINFLTGVETRAPLWMQRLGIEWLFRLAHDPRRLASRYLVRGPRIFNLLRRTQIILRPATAAGSAKPSAKATTGEIRIRVST